MGPPDQSVLKIMKGSKQATRVVYFTNELSFSISRIVISRMTKSFQDFILRDEIPAKFSKYKSLENFHLYGSKAQMSNIP